MLSDWLSKWEGMNMRISVLLILVAFLTLANGVAEFEEKLIAKYHSMLDSLFKGMHYVKTIQKDYFGRTYESWESVGEPDSELVRRKIDAFEASIPENVVYEYYLNDPTNITRRTFECLPLVVVISRLAADDMRVDVFDQLLAVVDSLYEDPSEKVWKAWAPYDYYRYKAAQKVGLSWDKGNMNYEQVFLVIGLPALVTNLLAMDEEGWEDAIYDKEFKLPVKIGFELSASKDYFLPSEFRKRFLYYNKHYLSIEGMWRGRRARLENFRLQLKPVVKRAIVKVMARKVEEKGKENLLEVWAYWKDKRGEVHNLLRGRVNKKFFYSKFLKQIKLLEKLAKSPDSYIKVTYDKETGRVKLDVDPNLKLFVREMMGSGEKRSRVTFILDWHPRFIWDVTAKKLNDRGVELRLWFDDRIKYFARARDVKKADKVMKCYAATFSPVNAVFERYELCSQWFEDSVDQAVDELIGAFVDMLEVDENTSEGVEKAWEKVADKIKDSKQAKKIKQACRRYLKRLKVKNRVFLMRVKSVLVYLLGELKLVVADAAGDAAKEKVEEFLNAIKNRTKITEKLGKALKGAMDKDNVERTNNAYYKIERAVLNGRTPSIDYSEVGRRLREILQKYEEENIKGDTFEWFDFAQSIGSSMESAQEEFEDNLEEVFPSKQLADEFMDAFEETPYYKVVEMWGLVGKILAKGFALLKVYQSLQMLKDYAHLRSMMMGEMWRIFVRGK